MCSSFNVSDHVSHPCKTTDKVNSFVYFDLPDMVVVVVVVV
jgi:hypothetical protein